VLQEKRTNERASTFKGFLKLINIRSGLLNAIVKLQKFELIVVKY